MIKCIKYLEPLPEYAQQHGTVQSVLIPTLSGDLGVCFENLLVGSLWHHQWARTSITVCLLEYPACFETPPTADGTNKRFI